MERKKNLSTTFYAIDAYSETFEGCVFKFIHVIKA